MRVDPVAAAFAAGRRSARGQVRVWRSAAVVMFLVGAGTRVVPLSGGGAGTSREAVAPTVVVRDRSPGMPAEPLSEQSLFVVQQAVVERGIDGLPAPRPPAAVRPARIGNTL
jgi:hypothetical protein